MTPPLPGLSVILYRVFAEAEGRWKTPNWIYGTATGPPHAYKELRIEWKPVKMDTNHDS